MRSSTRRRSTRSSSTDHGQVGRGWLGHADMSGPPDPGSVAWPRLKLRGGGAESAQKRGPDRSTTPARCGGRGLYGMRRDRHHRARSKWDVISRLVVPGAGFRPEGQLDPGVPGRAGGPGLSVDEHRIATALGTAQVERRGGRGLRRLDGMYQKRAERLSEDTRTGGVGAEQPPLPARQPGSPGLVETRRRGDPIRRPAEETVGRDPGGEGSALLFGRFRPGWPAGPPSTPWSCPCGPFRPWSTAGSGPGWSPRTDGRGP